MIEIPLFIPSWFTDLLDNGFAFITIFTLFIGLLGMASRSLAVASWGAFSVFTYMGLTANVQWMTNLIYVLLTLILVGFAFKLYRTEAAGGT